MKRITTKALRLSQQHSIGRTSAQLTWLLNDSAARFARRRFPTWRNFLKARRLHIRMQRKDAEKLGVHVPFPRDWAQLSADHKRKHNGPYQRMEAETVIREQERQVRQASERSQLTAEIEARVRSQFAE